MKRIAAIVLPAVFLASASCGDNPGKDGQEQHAEAGATTVRTSPGPDTVKSDTIFQPQTEHTMDTIRGTFVEVQEGDYLHFRIRDEDGELQSFWIPPDLPVEAYMPFLTHEYKTGQPVEIVWQDVERYVPQAGAKEVHREAKAIRAVD